MDPYTHICMCVYTSLFIINKEEILMLITVFASVMGHMAVGGFITTFYCSFCIPFAFIIFT